MDLLEWRKIREHCVCPCWGEGCGGGGVSPVCVCVCMRGRKCVGERAHILFHVRPHREPVCYT